jgi:hypothetical protein
VIALDTPAETRIGVAALVRAVPVAVVVAAAWALAWETTGSIRAADWLPYAIATALVLGVVLLAGAAVVPELLSLIAALLLVGFAAWTAASAGWAPQPSLARDDALLALLYAIAFVTPLFTLRTSADRLAALGVSVVGLSLLAVWTAVTLRRGHDVDLLYFGGRLDFPVTYWNGEAAASLIAFWPAIAVAAYRGAPLALRAAALGGATAMLCLWLGTQSKGGGVALAVSGVAVFALAGSRLRLLAPTVIVAGLGALAAVPLTEPYRKHGAAFGDAVRDAGTITLVLTAIGCAAGVVYALVDRRLEIGTRTRTAVGAGALGLLAASLLAGVVVFFVAVHHPVREAQQRWHEFKTLDLEQKTASHFGSLGSNRYDFWRVAWDEFERHPLVGIGAYGWGDAYLRHGHSLERPQRAHSLEMDVLSETGIVGALLLLSAGVLALVAVARRARLSLVSAGALGTGVYFAVHASGDWIWTIPALGLPALAVVGIGAAADDPRHMSARTAIPAGIVAVAVALLALLPPWLSSRLVERAYDQRTAAAASGNLRWARRLDPLAVEPLIAESALAKPPANVRPLRRAVAKQPRNAELHLLLGRALLDLGRKREARTELGIAAALSPRDEAIRNALRNAS